MLPATFGCCPHSSTRLPFHLPCIENKNSKHRSQEKDEASRPVARTTLLRKKPVCSNVVKKHHLDTRLHISKIFGPKTEHAWHSGNRSGATEAVPSFTARIFVLLTVLTTRHSTPR
ncbi:hypothetical protein ISCGN_027077 [Ixodes scapularis]